MPHPNTIQPRVPDPAPSIPFRVCTPWKPGSTSVPASQKPLMDPISPAHRPSRHSPGLEPPTFPCSTPPRSKSKLQVACCHLSISPYSHTLPPTRGITIPSGLGWALSQVDSGQTDELVTCSLLYAQAGLWPLQPLPLQAAHPTLGLTRGACWALPGGLGTRVLPWLYPISAQLWALTPAEKGPWALSLHPHLMSACSLSGLHSQPV